VHNNTFSIVLKYISLTIIVIIFSLLIHQVDTQQRQEIVLKHVEWISSETFLDYNGEELPNIKKISREEMAIRFYGIDPDPKNQTKKDLQKINNSNIAALYHAGKNTMYFDTNFSVRDWDTRHILVHELVHFMQKVNGFYNSKYCKGTLEALAYGIQGKWQREKNHPGQIPSSALLKGLADTCRK